MTVRGTLRPLAEPDLGQSGGPLSTHKGHSLISAAAPDSASRKDRVHLKADICQPEKHVPGIAENTTFETPHNY